MCNSVHVEKSNSNKFFKKITIIYLKVLYLILNIQVLIQNLYFKLCNMNKFAYDRKSLKMLCLICIAVY